MQPKFATSEQVRHAHRLVLRDYGQVFQWLACDEHLQECGLCHDLFDIQQVRMQFSGQVLCDRCSQTRTPEPGQECPDFERKQP
jgi:predicted anti-sigma-YlaC factor YlaD